MIGNFLSFFLSFFGLQWMDDGARNVLDENLARFFLEIRTGKGKTWTVLRVIGVEERERDERNTAGSYHFADWELREGGPNSGR